MQYTGDNRRIKCDLDSHSMMIDVETGSTPVLWRGTDWQFDFCFFLNGVLVDVSIYSAVTIEIKPFNSPTSLALLTETLETSDLDNTTDISSWDNYTKQHARFSFVHGSTNLDLGGQLNSLFLLVVHGFTTSSPGSKVVFGRTVIRVDEAGVNDASAPTPGDPDYYTAAESDARFTQNISVLYPLVISGGLSPTISVTLLDNVGSAVIDGSVMVYNASLHKWIPGSPSGTPTVLDDVDGKHRTLFSHGGVLQVSDPID